MRFKSSESSEGYYNHKINPKISVDSFFWNINEKKDLSHVLRYIQEKKKTSHLYLITTRLCFFPIGSKDKYYKLWKWVFNEFDITFNEVSEIEMLETRWVNYIGVAKVQNEQTEKALQILQRNSFTSCIISSNYNINIDELLDLYSKMFLKKDCNCVNFDSLINTLGVNNEIITAIEGYDSFSINFFNSNN